MRSAHLTFTIMACGLGLMLLAATSAGCPRQTPSSDTTTPPATGLPPAAPDPGASGEPDIAQPSSKTPSTGKILTPPYLTISAVVIPQEARLITGQTVTAYWELTEPLPATAWLGLVPQSIPATSQQSRAAALISEELAGRTMAMLSYQILEPGIYIWRMFDGSDPNGAPFLESEVFEVIQDQAAPKPAE